MRTVSVRGKKLFSILSYMTVFGLGLIIAAASFSGFYQKWAFRDNDSRMSLNAMLEGTASRPFAYRRLIVDTVNAIDRAVPQSAGELAERLLHRPDGSFRFAFPGFVGKDPNKAIRFELVYLSTYISAVMLLVVAYSLARSEGFEPAAAGAGSSLFLLTFPLLQSFGGYFYDYFEVLFFCTFLLFARRAWWPAMFAVAVLATWNKESFPFFALSAFPLLRERTSLRNSSAIICGCIVLAGLTYWTQRVRFDGNPGGTVENHVVDQISYFLDGRFLVMLELSYGVLLPHPFSLPWIVGIILAVWAGWRWVSPAMRQQISVAAAVNVPLFFLFCGPGEARNLSMLFPALVIVMTAGLQAVILHSSSFRSCKVEQ